VPGTQYMKIHFLGGIPDPVVIKIEWCINRKSKNIEEGGKNWL